MMNGQMQRLIEGAEIDLIEVIVSFCTIHVHQMFVEVDKVSDVVRKNRMKFANTSSQIWPLSCGTMRERRNKRRAYPRDPTAAERAIHEVTPLPFHSWCVGERKGPDLDAADVAQRALMGLRRLRFRGRVLVKNR